MNRARIRAGELPSTLLREELSKHPNLRNADLARLFVAEFPGVDWVLATATIWNWRRPDGLRDSGISDEELDSALTDLLANCGYVAATSSAKIDD